MPTIITHAIAAGALGMAVQTSRGLPPRCWVAAAVCAALPDADVIAFSFGIPYSHLLGHRGLSHSLVFAAVAALVAAIMLRKSTTSAGWFRLWFFFFVAGASHGVLDAMTNGGLGVAFFSPWETKRYFFGWRPILVAPIGITRFFSEWGLAVLKSEALWIWLPSIVFALVVWAVRKPKRVSSGAV